MNIVYLVNLFGVCHLFHKDIYRRIEEQGTLRFTLVKVADYKMWGGGELWSEEHPQSLRWKPIQSAYTGVRSECKGHEKDVKMCI